MNLGSELRCPACGAAVPLGAGATSRCAFCLGEVEVPASQRRSVTEDRVLEQRIVAAARDYKAARAQTRAGRGALWQSLFWVIVALLVLVLGSGFYAAVLAVGGHGLEVYEPAILIAPLLTVGVYGIAIVMILVNLGFGRASEFRRLARVPFALPLGDRASCPSCGAALRAGGAITARCGSCRTEALLPSHMVAARLKKRHHDVACAHRKTRHHRRGQALGAVASQGCAGLLFLGLACSIIVGMPAAIWGVEQFGPLPWNRQEIVVGGLIPAFFISVVFGWSAVAMLNAAWQGIRSGIR